MNHSKKLLAAATRFVDKKSELKEANDAMHQHVNALLSECKTPDDIRRLIEQIPLGYSGRIRLHQLMLAMDYGRDPVSK